MDNNKTTVVMDTRETTDKISRSLLAWLNSWTGKPLSIGYEFLPSDAPGMALSTIQGAYITRQYIRGAYEGQYQFKVIYRLQPSSNNARLSADETLDALGDWATAEKPLPDLGGGKVAKKITCNTRAAMFARYEDGSEDHQIMMTLDYISI